MSNKTTKQQNHEEFGKKILSAVPHLHPYVKHRLYIFETSGIIPRNMYKISGIIDDAILQYYETFEQEDVDSIELKLRLFRLTNERLDELQKNEEWHLNTLSTSKILKKELNQLEEKFKLDIDEDLIMDEELDDISYHQGEEQKERFLYDDAEQNIIKSLEINDLRSEMNTEKRKRLNKIYSWLPVETSNLIDLYVFGKLNYQEIGIVKNIDAGEVKKIITTVRKSFRKNLD
ncbi:hypothetical protein [Abyssalbus ytuae]|uniref:Uncharacterized protein n=1 Tax=Abyssalbus ytuae TaxID=2926907 RepID=A0A9E6ZL24_9FLAO|nr:hypothetical protein [Abyssalbus ytuae]UOB17732.1 hypothetical protein MQE35_00190 [Abyssalbus ytuae]